MRNGYNCSMAEAEREIEVAPGIKFNFTRRGITDDAFNAWLPDSMLAMMGNFDEVVPVRHYEEYLQYKDEQYKQAGKPGLYEGVMAKSNPDGIAEFDQLVDEFNADLPKIKEQRDNEAVQAFYRRAGELKMKGDETPKLP